MITLSLSPEKEAELRARASAAGKDVSEYAVEILEEELAIAEAVSLPHPLSSSTPDPWLEEFRAWVAGHPEFEQLADDSRESIYAGRGE
jgi:hypothetical protein